VLSGDRRAGFRGFSREVLEERGLAELHVLLVVTAVIVLGIYVLLTGR